MLQYFVDLNAGMKIFMKHRHGKSKKSTKKKKIMVQGYLIFKIIKSIFFSYLLAMLYLKRFNFLHGQEILLFNVQRFSIIKKKFLLEIRIKLIRKTLFLRSAYHTLAN